MLRHATVFENHVRRVTIELPATMTGQDFATQLNEGVATVNDHTVSWFDAQTMEVKPAIIVHTEVQPAQRSWHVVHTDEHFGCCTRPAQAADQERINSMLTWIQDYTAQHRFNEAARLLRFCRQFVGTLSGQDRDIQLETLSGVLAQERGRIKQAIRHYRRALLRASAMVTPDAIVVVAIAQCNLAEGYVVSGQFAKAQPLMDAGMSVLTDRERLAPLYTEEAQMLMLQSFAEARDALAAHAQTRPA